MARSFKIIPGQHPQRNWNWNDLKEMLEDCSSRFHYLSGDIQNFAKEWIRKLYGLQGARNYEEIHAQLRHDWLPGQNERDGQDVSTAQLPPIAAVYKETETDLQKFGVALRQANLDEKINEGKTFNEAANDVVQVLDNIRQHMDALKIQRNPPVGEDIMDSEKRRAQDRPDSKAIRDYVTLHQLWLYTASRSKIFKELKNHPELKPDNVAP